MPMSLQVKLLRVIQEREITPVGANHSKKVDVRIIAATNANLEELISQKKFREDLYYRLNVLPIKLAPLRDRAEDIPYLAAHFLEEANQRAGKDFKLLESSLEHLVKLKWPGNVRQLQNEIRRLVNSSDGAYLDLSHLSSECVEQKSVFRKPTDYLSFKYKNLNAEKQMIEQALKTSQSLSAAARSLDMKRSTLRDKIKKYGIILSKEQEQFNEEIVYE